MKSRDRRFDGVFYTGVTSTGIYCRPSCPALTPQRRNVTFHRTAAAAQAAGFRACKRCLPDATPGSPDWDVAADVAGRAMRLIADGVVEREGVAGLAGRIGYTTRHLGRVLVTELGAGPLALARARRAQTARVLIETTAMPFSDVAFAAGFASVRQFNDTVREVYAASPTELRAARRPVARSAAGGAGDAGARSTCGSRCGRRSPPASCWPSSPCTRCRASRRSATAGTPGRCRCRTVPGGSGSSSTTAPSARGTCAAASRWPTCATSPAGVERCRRLLDADCDPVAVDDGLAGDPAPRPAGPAAAGAARARPRRRRGDRGPDGDRPAGVGCRGDDGHRPARGAGTAPHTPTAAPGLPDRLFPDAPPCSPRSTRRTCRCRGRGAGRWSALCRALAGR